MSMPTDKQRFSSRTRHREQLLLLQHAVQHVVVNLRGDLEIGVLVLADLLEEVHALFVDQTVHQRGGNLAAVLIAEHVVRVLRSEASYESLLPCIESRTLGTR